MVKTCYTCRLEKPTTEFYLDRGKPAYRCKLCSAKADKASKALRDKPYADSSRRWREKNPERQRAAGKRWYENNRDKHRAKARIASPKRRAMKLRAIPSWANEFFISEAYHLAALRTKMLGFKWNVDHIVPLQNPLVCGLHVEHNLQVVPEKYNQKKNNRHWPDMP